MKRRKNNVSWPVVLIVVFLFLAQACGSSKGPFIPVEQMQAEAPTRVTEFILGSGDKIEITVYRHDDLKRTVQVDLSGKVGFPLIGDVQAAGLGIFEFRDKVRDGLAKYIIDPQVTMSVTSSQSQKIIVLGEVKSPGYFQADSAITALEAISRAGGFTLEGKLQSVMLIRGDIKKPQLYRLNLAKALKEGDFSQNVALQRGDVLYVPRTFIANVDSFFQHAQRILSPFATLEAISSEGGIIAISP